MKYIFVTGGVVSSIGKGIVAASLGRLLKDNGYRIAIQKFDPYLNIDPGTMSPYQHGEVFVTEDGAETDLDIGHYERFIDTPANAYSSVTSGKVYSEILEKERRGDYLGKTVQVIPHVTDALKEKMQRVGSLGQADIVITEVGGTIGDIESLPFLESIRQMKRSLGEENVVLIHTTLVPYIKAAKEFKTKPTQHSVKEMRSLGLQPDILVLRSDQSLDQELKDKIALFCDVDSRDVIESPDVPSIYDIPQVLKDQVMDLRVLDHFGLVASHHPQAEWTAFIDRMKNVTGTITIGLVGKYVALQDAYLSVVESLKHAAWQEGRELAIDWILAEDLEGDCDLSEKLGHLDGILVPGGFGQRGIEGKLAAIQFARENKVPFLGICLGMQLTCIEFARNVVGLEGADTTEDHDQVQDPIIDLMADKRDLDQLGGTLRLGTYPCVLQKGSLAHQVYGQDQIDERHRHRYEFNNAYRDQLGQAGLTFSGLSPDGRLVEIVEIKDHPYFIACQFHPEFKSRPTRPHPLFTGLIQAAIKR